MIFALLLISYTQVNGQDFIFDSGFEIVPAKLIHRWSFSESGPTGTTLIDDIGGADGTIVEVGTNDAWVGFGQLRLTGGEQENSDYASLPPGLLSQLANASIEIWGTQESVQSFGRIFDA